VALEAGARRLVLTHISSRYNRDASELLAEAKSVFPDTIIARDGLTLEIPYADGETPRP
jgi:ribonuclease Z